jgi:hypothetical protein
MGRNQINVMNINRVLNRNNRVNICEGPVDLIDLAVARRNPLSERISNTPPPIKPRKNWLKGEEK